MTVGDLEGSKARLKLCSLKKEKKTCKIKSILVCDTSHRLCAY